MSADTDGSQDAPRTSFPGPLDGLVVADFSRVLAGPYATMMLADLGATVTKIERPGVGDDTRAWGPPYDAAGTATYFNAVNRNKLSRTLDLTTADGRSAALDLAGSADVLIENFRPGVMDRLGLGYDAVHERNPRLVYCSISGFGEGAGADLGGYDLLVQAVGGLMSITGEPDGPPDKVGVALVDIITGLHAGMGILAALRHRDATGVGQRVQVTLMNSLLSALTNQATAYLQAGKVAQRRGNRHPSITPYEVVGTADRPLALAVGNDRQFVALCHAVGRPELADDPRFETNAARVGHRERLAAILGESLRTRSADEWATTLQAAGVPAGPVNSIDQAFALAERLGLDPVWPGGTVRNPIELSETPATFRSPPPPLGA